MNILVLEDDPIRQKFFLKNLSNMKVVIVMTAQEAITQLQNNTWTYLFLDHDLGDDENTGYTVAKWLESNPVRKPSEIYIHSLNSVGAINMKQAIPEAILAPGCWNYIGIEE